jgi:hypothetical protein
VIVPGESLEMWVCVKLHLLPMQVVRWPEDPGARRMIAVPHRQKLLQSPLAGKFGTGV